MGVSGSATSSANGGDLDDNPSLAPFRIAPSTGGRAGVLLVHGFVGSPWEMKALGQSLAGRGYAVSGVALAGHGPDWRRLRKTTWHDWYRSVEAAFDELRRGCEVVGVCGQSLGGLLTLELARRRGEQVGAISTLAAALWIKPWMARGIRTARNKWIWRHLDIPRLGGSDVADKASNRQLPTKGGMPIGALNEMLDAQEAIVPHLGEVRCPSLVIHSPHDHTIPFACAEHLAAHLGGPVERMNLERSFHVISVDVEREALFARVGEFFDRALVLPASVTVQR